MLDKNGKNVTVSDKKIDKNSKKEAKNAPKLEWDPCNIDFFQC